MNHTKGEWRVGNPCHPNWAGEHTKIYAPKENAIEGTIIKIADTNLTTLISIAERMSNARLIASAPDMYQTLKSLADAYQIDIGATDLTYYPEYWQQLIKSIRKAEGK